MKNRLVTRIKAQRRLAVTATPGCAEAALSASMVIPSYRLAMMMLALLLCRENIRAISTHFRPAASRVAAW